MILSYLLAYRLNRACQTVSREEEWWWWYHISSLSRPSSRIHYPCWRCQGEVCWVNLTGLQVRFAVNKLNSVRGHISMLWKGRNLKPCKAYVSDAVDLHLSKALFSLDPDNLHLQCFLGLGASFCYSFFCSLDQPCKTLQTVQVAPSDAFVNTKEHFRTLK